MPAIHKKLVAYWNLPVAAIWCVPTHKRIPYVPQSSAGLTGFLGKLPLLGMKQAQCSLLFAETQTPQWLVFVGHLLLDEGRENKGLPNLSQSLVFWTFPLECFIYSKLSTTSQPELLICTLPSKSGIAFIFFDWHSGITILSCVQSRNLEINFFLTPSSPTYFPLPPCKFLSSCFDSVTNTYQVGSICSVPSAICSASGWHRSLTWTLWGTS